MLPHQISADGPSGGSIGVVNIVSVPSGSYLSLSDIERLRAPALPPIEHEPIEPATIEPATIEPEARQDEAQGPADASE